MEAVNIIVYAFVTFALEIGGRFHVPAALSPGENPVPNKQVTGWAIVPVWTVLEKKKISCFPREWNPIPNTSSP